MHYTKTFYRYKTKPIFKDQDITIINFKINYEKTICGLEKNTKINIIP